MTADEPSDRWIGWTDDEAEAIDAWKSEFEAMSLRELLDTWPNYE